MNTELFTVNPVLTLRLTSQQAYRRKQIQFSNETGPDGVCFATETEAAVYAAAQYPQQWGSGECWIIPAP